MSSKHLWFLASALGGLTALPAPLLAQVPVDETRPSSAGADDAVGGDIIVTARRKAESLQTVPIAVTAVGQDVLTRTGSFSPLDIAQIAPGIRTSGSSGNRSDVAYSIRGQGITFGNIFPSVIPYFAEVPIVTEFSTGSFFDLENIQILRGPQGVRFGRVTDGGAVLVQPKKPTNDLGGYVKATVGDFDLNTVEAAINLPIVADTVLLRVAGERARRGGFTLNVPNNQKLDNVHYDTIRASLTVRPIAGIENTTVFQYNEGHENNSNALSAVLATPAKFPIPSDLAAITAALDWQNANGSRRVQNGDPLLGSDYGLFNDRKQTIISNATRINITDDIQFRNIFGYIRARKFAGFDYDGSPLFIVNAYGRYAPRLDSRHISDEAQFSGKSFGILDWALGVYFDNQEPGGFSEQPQVQRPTPTLPFVRMFSSFSLQTTKSSAVYGQGELDLSSVAPGLKVNGGLRYTHDSNRTRAANYTVRFDDFVSPSFVHDGCPPKALTDRAAVVPPAACTVTTLGGAFNAVTYEMGASYEVNRALFTYVSYRKGYRPGGFNTFLSPLFPDGAYQPEYDKSLEVGLKAKGTLGAVPFRVNVAAFYDRYTNIQKRITLLAPSGAGITALLNVRYPATVKGIEFEGNISPIDGLDIGYNFALTDAKFSTKGSDPAVLNDSLTGACNNKAPRNLDFCPYNRFSLTPKFQMTASLGYTLPLASSLGKVRIAFDLYHQTSMPFSDSSFLNPDAVMSGYTLLNGNINWKDVGGENLDLSVFVSNITNTVYWQGAQSVSHNASLGIGAHFYAPPRMFGVSATMRFGE